MSNDWCAAAVAAEEEEEEVGEFGRKLRFRGGKEKTSGERVASRYRRRCDKGLVKIER